MIYIETGSADVFVNFATEYYFAAEKELGEEPLFLFWRTSPTLMLGKYQNAYEEIDLPQAQARGVQIVRRLSGGGTIYTDMGGWQFTFITSGDTGEIQFAQYIQPVIAALRSLGVAAEFNGRNDLVIDGRKCSGSAQYKLPGKTVHHGSLLFDTDIEEMVRLTTVDPQKIQSKSIKSVRDRVTNISEHLPEKCSPEQFKARMLDAILHGNRREYALTEADRSRIRELAAEKFDNWQAVFGVTPKFSIEKTARLAGGRITFSLEVKRGRIEHCGVSGDFFAAVDASAFEQALKGCPYRMEAIEAALKSAGLDGAIYHIGAPEMARLMTQ